MLHSDCGSSCASFNSLDGCNQAAEWKQSLCKCCEKPQSWSCSGGGRFGQLWLLQQLQGPIKVCAASQQRGPRGFSMCSSQPYVLSMPLIRKLTQKGRSRVLLLQCSISNWHALLQLILLLHTRAKNLCLLLCHRWWLQLYYQTITGWHAANNSRHTFSHQEKIPTLCLLTPLVQRVGFVSRAQQQWASLTSKNAHVLEVPLM
jgi:hypothetical protein